MRFVSCSGGDEAAEDGGGTPRLVGRGMINQAAKNNTPLYYTNYGGERATYFDVLGGERSGPSG